MTGIGTNVEPQYTEADWTDYAHTGPGTLAGRYLRRFWHPVARAQDLAAGRALPIKIMSENVTVYRGEGGTPYAVDFRCAHRGTQLSTGWVEGDNLRCFYHGWVYGPDGQCVEQPAETEPFCQRIKIRSYPTREYLGLVFIYLGEGQPPELPRFPELEDEGVLEVRRPVSWPCNYFNRIENSADEVHLAFVHGDSQFSENGLVDIPKIDAEETEFGFTKWGMRADGVKRYSHFHMPNTNFIKGSPNDEESGWVEHLSWRVPIDDESCKSFVVQLVHVTGEAADRYQARRREQLQRAAQVAPTNEVAEAVLRGELRIQDIEERTNIVNVQDYVAQVGQGPIADRANERLGQSDRVMVLLRGMWSRELRALAEGRPLKQWQRTRRVEVTTGV